MTLRIPRTSVQYLEVPVSSDTVEDPTALPVLFGFTATKDPPMPALAGNWTTRDAVNYARILVGGIDTGATVELDVGLWHVWIKVDGNPEDPVIRAGIVVITGGLPAPVVVGDEIDGGTP